MKKKLTKLSIIFLLISACSIFLIGCEEVASVEGTTWKVAGAVNAEGKEITSKAMEAIVGEITYEFKSEGVLVAAAATVGKTIEGTWSQTDEFVVLMTPDGKSYTVEIDDDKFTVEDSGVVITFEKK